MPPYLFNDAIDDPIEFALAQSFEGGMVSNQRASTLAENQAALMVNMDVTRTNEIATRRGTALVGGGSVHSGGAIIRLARFSTSTIEQLVASVNNGGLPNRLYYYVDGGAWTLATAAIPMQSGYCPIVQGLDKLYVRGSDLHLYSWDGTTAVDLGGGGANQPPLGGPALEWFTDRVITSDGRDALAFSDILDGTTWPAENSIRVGAGEDDVIVGTVKWTDFNLIVLKRRSIWYVNCDPTLTPAEFEIKTLHSKIGTRAPQTFVQVEGDVIGLTTQGVRSMQQTYADEKQARLGPPLSFPVDDIINRINKTYVHTATATYWKNRYMLAVPLDSSSVPNYVLVFNTITGSWTGYWTGWTPTAFAERLITADSSLRMVFGDSAGNVFEWMDYVPVASEVTATYQDNGGAITSQLTSRAFDFGEPLSNKTGLNCEVSKTSTGTVTLNIYRDGVLSSSGSILSTETRKAFDLQGLGVFRELQLDVTASAGKMTVTKLSASAFVETLQLQT